MTVSSKWSVQDVPASMALPAWTTISGHIITDYDRACVHHVPLPYTAADSDALCERFGYSDE